MRSYLLAAVGIAVLTAALAFDRDRLLTEAARVTALHQADVLKSALLSSRIEGGAPRAGQDWYAAPDLLGNVIEVAAPATAGHPLLAAG